MADTDLCKAMDEAFPPEPGAGVDLPTLESTAKAATPGPWAVDRERRVLSTFNDGNHEVCAVDRQWFANRGPHNAAFIAAWNPTTALSILSRLREAEAEVERLNAACREQFEAATHNAKACNELTAKVEQQKRRADNHWESLRSIREFAREGDCERIILWVNDSGSGYVETAEQTLGVWIDKATTAEALVGELVEALEKARHQFMGYVISHKAKSTPDGDAKAVTNAAFADMCAAALSKVAPVTREQSQ